MTPRKEFETLKKTMRYVVKDEVWYKLIYFDTVKKICRVREIGSHNNATERNTKTYEEAANIYTIEIVEEIFTPDQYFLMKINDGADLVKTIPNRRLISYLTAHKEECPKVIDMLVEFVRSHEDIKVRKCAYQVLSAIELEEYKELEEYINKEEQQLSQISEKAANKRKR